MLVGFLFDNAKLVRFSEGKQKNKPPYAKWCMRVYEVFVMCMNYYEGVCFPKTSCENIHRRSVPLAPFEGAIQVERLAFLVS